MKQNIQLLIIALLVLILAIYTPEELVGMAILTSIAVIGVVIIDTLVGIYKVAKKVLRWAYLKLDFYRRNMV